MGFRYRKSIKLGKGVRLNINKGSVSMSAGGKGARVTVNSKGRKTTTVGPSRHRYILSNHIVNKI